jgi:hypothetical protein
MMHLDEAGPSQFLFHDPDATVAHHIFNIERGSFRIQVGRLHVEKSGKENEKNIKKKQSFHIIIK